MKNLSWTNYFALLTLLSFAAAGVAYAAQAEGTKQAAVPETIHQVALIDGEAFPNELIIPIGDRVQFNSQDGLTHDISTGKGNDYDHEHEHVTTGVSSGHFGPDEAYLVTLPGAGTYYFHDHYNPDAFITVLVYEPEA
ncbi:MAG TPA: hypothetical protein VGB97_04620 [Candidatus Paceibacterota bacterium]|jgi:plastocyanin